MKRYFLLITCLLPATLFAEVKLPSIFTSNMVLQQKSNVAFWGWATPNATITITPSWNKLPYRGKADQNGKWRFKVPTPAAGGPYRLTVSDGKAVTLDNVLLGEVWFCTGQSNMEMPVKGFRGQPVIGSNEAILRSANDQIRVYTVPRSSVLTKQENSKPSEWKIAGPESVANFSATGYFFGKLLSDMLHVPIGLVNDSYGGSWTEAWMSPEALKAFPEIKVPALTDTIKAVSRTPTTLYNGMIYPVVGFTMKGAIWYQGESNYERPDQYETLFPAMVNEWRSEWDNGEFPFYYAQIAPYDYAQLPPYNKGGKFNSAFLRDAQRKSADKIPNSAMAVLMDVGEKASIHPMHKREGGERLAYLALALTYGIKGIGFASPAYESAAFGAGAAQVKFKNAANGLTTFGKEPLLFEIAGADKVFYPAKAVINGNTITLTSTDVKDPVAVRYAFRDFVIGELFGTDGLPVSSFRTDDWER